MPKSWSDKYQTRKTSVVKIVSRGFADIKPGMSMLISTPAEIEHEIRKIRKGQEMSFAELRHHLAQTYGVDKTCPLTTSIFLRIDAEIALEAMAGGKPFYRVLPFWRVISSRSPLAQKLSCGPQLIEQLRQHEGLPA